MQSTRTFTPRRIFIAIIGVLILAAIAAAVVYAVTRPTDADYDAAKTSQLNKATKAREALTPAVNAYLTAFKAAYNRSDSAESATTKAKPEYDAYKKAERTAYDAMTALSDSRISNDGETGAAVDQLKQDYDAEVTFYTGLVESYADYTVLFATQANRCSGVFVGQAEGLADRKNKLDQAAGRCFAALDDLKQSANVSYVEYAKKVERRVKQMQSYAATTVAAEKKLKEFEARAAEYQQEYAEAKKRNASADEIYKLADELKAFNAQIAENKADFDFAAKRYISTVKEMPTLYADVYDKAVPAKQDYYDRLVDMRTSVLSLVLESKGEVE